MAVALISRNEKYRMPVLVVCIGLLVSGLVAFILYRQQSAVEEERFHQLVERVATSIQGRLDDHSRELKALRGLVIANAPLNNSVTYPTSSIISRSQWSRYSQQRSLADFPGALGFGFARYVPRESLERFVSETRVDGVPEFQVKTKGDAKSLFVIQYIEPLQPNLPALGLDIGAEALRRQAAEAAVEQDKVMLTRPITLVQDQKKLPGFVMLLPVYSNDANLHTAQGRWAGLLGWVNTPIRIDQLLDGVVKVADRQIDFELFQDDHSKPENLIFDADEHLKGMGNVVHTRELVFSGRRFNHQAYLDVFGQRWEFLASTTPVFDARNPRILPLLTLAVGVVISLLLGLLVNSLALMRQKAQALAEQLTVDARDSERRAQQALTRMQQMQFAIDQHAIVATTDVHGTITYVNDHLIKLSGYSREELVGANHRLLNSGLHDEAFWRAMYRVVASGAVWHGDIRNRAKDGSLYWVRSTIVPLKGEKGKPVEYVVIRTDITQQKRNEEALATHRDRLQELVAEQTEHLIAAKDAAEAANQAKSEFLSNMSHELRTPLHGILSFARLGESKFETLAPAKVGDYFHHIRTAADRLLNLLNNLLDLSKLEAGKVSLDLKPSDLFALVREAEQEFSALAASRSIVLSCRDERAIESARAIPMDPTRIGQVIRNLLSNALKFSPEGGRVAVRVYVASTEDGEAPDLCLDVSDTGVGIPADELEDVFDKFVQSTKTKTGAGGTGLGLAICREIVHAHHGEIFARNNAEVGATFTMRLPFTP